MSTQKEVGEHLDLSDRQIRNLVKDSILPGAKKGSGLNIDDCRKAYINYLRNMSKRPEKPEISPEELDIEAEKAGLVKAQRIAQELKNEILEGRSLPADAVRDVVGKVLIAAAGIFSALPLNIKRKFPEIEKRVIDLIHEDIVRLQNEAAMIDEYIDQAIDDAITEAEEKV